MVGGREEKEAKDKVRGKRIHRPSHPYPICGSKHACISDGIANGSLQNRTTILRSWSQIRGTPLPRFPQKHGYVRLEKLAVKVVSTTVDGNRGRWVGARQREKVNEKEKEVG